MQGAEEASCQHLLLFSATVNFVCQSIPSHTTSDVILLSFRFSCHTFAWIENTYLIMSLTSCSNLAPLHYQCNNVFFLQDRYVCAVTRDVLGNSVPCAVLRPSWVCLPPFWHSDDISSLLGLWGHNWNSLSCVQGYCGNSGVCGEVNQEGHDWSCDWRPTVQQRHHTTAEGMCVFCVEVGGVHSQNQEVYDFELFHGFQKLCLVHWI